MRNEGRNSKNSLLRNRAETTSPPRGEVVGDAARGLLLERGEGGGLGDAGEHAGQDVGEDGLAVRALAPEHGEALLRREPGDAVADEALDELDECEVALEDLQEELLPPRVHGFRAVRGGDALGEVEVLGLLGVRPERLGREVEHAVADGEEGGVPVELFDRGRNAVQGAEFSDHGVDAAGGLDVGDQGARAGLAALGVEEFPGVGPDVDVVDGGDPSVEGGHLAEDRALNPVGHLVGLAADPLLRVVLPDAGGGRIDQEPEGGRPADVGALLADDRVEGLRVVEVGEEAGHGLADALGDDLVGAVLGRRLDGLDQGGPERRPERLAPVGEVRADVGGDGEAPDVDVLAGQGLGDALGEVLARGVVVARDQDTAALEGGGDLGHGLLVARQSGAANQDDVEADGGGGQGVARALGDEDVGPAGATGDETVLAPGRTLGVAGAGPPNLDVVGERPGLEVVGAPLEVVEGDDQARGVVVAGLGDGEAGRGDRGVVEAEAEVERAGLVHAEAGERVVGPGGAREVGGGAVEVLGQGRAVRGGNGRRVRARRAHRREVARLDGEEVTHGEVDGGEHGLGLAADAAPDEDVVGVGVQGDAERGVGVLVSRAGGGVAVPVLGHVVEAVEDVGEAYQGGGWSERDQKEVTPGQAEGEPVAPAGRCVAPARGLEQAGDSGGRLDDERAHAARSRFTRRWRRATLFRRRRSATSSAGTGLLGGVEAGQEGAEGGERHDDVAVGGALTAALDDGGAERLLGVNGLLLGVVHVGGQRDAGLVLGLEGEGRDVDVADVAEALVAGAAHDVAAEGVGQEGPDLALPGRALGGVRVAWGRNTGVVRVRRAEEQHHEGGVCEQTEREDHKARCAFLIGSQRLSHERSSGLGNKESIRCLHHVAEAQVLGVLAGVQDDKLHAGTVDGEGAGRGAGDAAECGLAGLAPRLGVDGDDHRAALQVGHARISVRAWSSGHGWRPRMREMRHSSLTTAASARSGFSVAASECSIRARLSSSGQGQATAPAVVGRKVLGDLGAATDAEVGEDRAHDVGRPGAGDLGDVGHLVALVEAARVAVVGRAHEGRGADDDVKVGHLHADARVSALGVEAPFAFQEPGERWARRERVPVSQAAARANALGREDDEVVEVFVQGGDAGHNVGGSLVAGSWGTRKPPPLDDERRGLAGGSGQAVRLVEGLGDLGGQTAAGADLQAGRLGPRADVGDAVLDDGERGGVVRAGGGSGLGLVLLGEGDVLGGRGEEQPGGGLAPGGQALADAAEEGVLADRALDVVAEGGLEEPRPVVLGPGVGAVQDDDVGLGHVADAVLGLLLEEEVGALNQDQAALVVGDLEEVVVGGGEAHAVCPRFVVVFGVAPALYLRGMQRGPFCPLLGGVLQFADAGLGERGEARGPLRLVLLPDVGNGLGGFGFGDLLGDRDAAPGRGLLHERDDQVLAGAEGADRAGQRVRGVPPGLDVEPVQRGRAGARGEVDDDAPLLRDVRERGARAVPVVVLDGAGVDAELLGDLPGAEFDRAAGLQVEDVVAAGRGAVGVRGQGAGFEVDDAVVGAADLDLVHDTEAFDLQHLEGHHDGPRRADGRAGLGPGGLQRRLDQGVQGLLVGVGVGERGRGQVQVPARGDAEDGHAGLPLAEVVGVLDGAREGRGPGVGDRRAAVGRGDEGAAPAVTGEFGVDGLERHQGGAPLAARGCGLGDMRGRNPTYPTCRGPGTTKAPPLRVGETGPGPGGALDGSARPLRKVEAGRVGREGAEVVNGAGVYVLDVDRVLVERGLRRVGVAGHPAAEEPDHRGILVGRIDRGVLLGEPDVRDDDRAGDGVGATDEVVGPGRGPEHVADGLRAEALEEAPDLRAPGRGFNLVPAPYFDKDGVAVVGGEDLREGGLAGPLLAEEADDVRGHGEVLQVVEVLVSARLVQPRAGAQGLDVVPRRIEQSLDGVEALLQVDDAVGLAVDLRGVEVALSAGTRVGVLLRFEDLLHHEDGLLRSGDRDGVHLDRRLLARDVPGGSPPEQAATQEQG
ncbi:hypothetical protein Q3G72_028758 [Acer saccharum]|nr:hypothetical protein Q3G72_028758 [Acer saccharum]